MTNATAVAMDNDGDELAAVKAELAQVKEAYELAMAKAELARLKGEVKVQQDVKKNHRPGKPSATRKYILLAKKMADWGVVPRQQADLAAILSNNMEVGNEY